MPSSRPQELAGSSAGLHFDGGKDTKDTPVTKIENTYRRIMPGMDLRLQEMLDVQAA